MSTESKKRFSVFLFEYFGLIFYIGINFRCNYLHKLPIVDKWKVREMPNIGSFGVHIDGIYLIGFAFSCSQGKFLKEVEDSLRVCVEVTGVWVLPLLMYFY